MGALAAVTRLVSAGERIVTGDDIYGGTSRLLAEIVPRQGIEVVNVDCCDLAAVKAAITPNTKLVRASPPPPPPPAVPPVVRRTAAPLTQSLHGAVPRRR
jgi:cystathionine beta-lyase